MMDRENILYLIKKNSAEIRERFTVAKIGVFGSCVRDEASPESDIDILVEFEKPTFDNYMELKFFLEDILGAEVDLVLADALKPRLKPYIDRDVIYA
jgi:predicted nucleotidyltransferase